LGELVADPARGLVYGNRGCLHDAGGRIRRRYNGKRWIACRLRFRGWHRAPLLQPGRFTELFFVDEATAFAAGHRPCALCRREDYDRFGAIWAGLHGGEAGADAIDLRLHGERVDPETRAQRTHTSPVGSLPDGAFVLRDGEETDDESVHDLLGPERTRAAEPLHLRQRCLDVGYSHVEGDVPGIALGRLADPAADADTLARQVRAAVDHGVAHGVRGVE